MDVSMREHGKYLQIPPRSGIHLLMKASLYPQLILDYALVEIQGRAEFPPPPEMRLRFPY